MRQEVKDYVAKIIKQHKILGPICEIGSLRVPWQVEFADLRPLFPGKKYIGCDYQLGPGVDRAENIHYLTFPDNSMGSVLILDTLEHVANVYRAMDEAYRILKPGGIIIITSVMNYPVHNFPDDYWRFTPRAFELLLEKFEEYEVKYDGNKDFPVGIYGFGIKAKDEKLHNKYETEIDLNNINSAQTRIINLIGKNKTVLEFGCNSGFTSKFLKKNGCKVTGVEVNTYAAKMAKKYCERVITGDIETINYDEVLGKNLFDIIVFADVLEHLKNPELILVKIKKFLDKKGKLVISLPNIAHGSVRLEILSGDFEYEKFGILDDTHLRHFTKKSILRLLDSSGYFVEKIDVISKRLAKETIKKYLVKIGVNQDEDLIRVFNQPEALAYQYIITSSLVEPPNYSTIGMFSKPVKIIKNREIIIGESSEDKNDLEKILNSRGWKIFKAIHKIRTKIPILKNL